jgi:hypothetical protein
MISPSSPKSQWKISATCKCPESSWPGNRNVVIKLWLDSSHGRGNCRSTRLCVNESVVLIKTDRLCLHQLFCRHLLSGECTFACRPRRVESQFLHLFDLHFAVAGILANQFHVSLAPQNLSSMKIVFVLLAGFLVTSLMALEDCIPMRGTAVTKTKQMCRPIEPNPNN